MSKSDRSTVFARAALKKGLVSKQQAQECLAISRKLEARGKALPIETVFVRKGYLRQAEAAALLKRMRPKRQGNELELLPSEPVSSRCPSCERDPGRGSDCVHCGADLASGGPGPEAEICQACSGIVLASSAICLHCGATLRRRRRRPRGRGSGAADKLVLLATAAGMAYFLVYRNLMAPPAPPAPLDAAQSGEVAAKAIEETIALTEQGKPGEAAAGLERALEALGKRAETRPERLRLLRALALVAAGARAREAAQEVLDEAEDPRLRRRLADLALAEGEPKQARAELKRIAPEARQDGDWRLLARVERQLEGDWISPLSEVSRLEGGEARQLALGLWERAQEAIAAGKLPAAQADLERGLALAPKEAGLRATLGALHLRRGRHADARQAYQEAIKLDPRPASSYLGLGLALEGLHEGARAAKAYEEFLRLAADQADQAARVEQVKARLQALRQ